MKERVAAVGVEMAKALVGLHNFSGADRGGKSNNVSEKTSCSVLYAFTEDAVVKKLKWFGFTCSVWVSHWSLGKVCVQCALKLKSIYKCHWFFMGTCQNNKLWGRETAIKEVCDGV